MMPAWRAATIWKPRLQSETGNHIATTATNFCRFGDRGDTYLKATSHHLLNGERSTHRGKRVVVVQGHRRATPAGSVMV
jgi:hypothetical protein